MHGWVIAIVAVAAAAVAVTTGSCGDTRTNLCEASGRRCSPGWGCALYEDACIPVGGCGDGIINPAIGEVCDDGNVTSRDGCRSDCMSDETCGNGKLDLEAGETCDDGNTESGDGCSALCLKEECGNFVLDRGEVCDDGNMVSRDGCRADCKSNEVCGNGILDAHLGEECEFPAPFPFPGPVPDTVACDSDCTLPKCGDGHLNRMLEQCDPGAVDLNGNGTDSASCNGDCTPVVCGDHHVNHAAGEECEFADPGSVHDTADCNADCTRPRCGDNRTNPFAFSTKNPSMKEQCDAGGVDTATCDGDCTVPLCGDGYTNQEFIPPYAMEPENCDTGGNTLMCNGNDSNHDGIIDDGIGSCRKSRCGDGYLNPAAGEVCDPGADGQHTVGCPGSSVCVSSGTNACKQCV
ncbi:MAG TPA: DUF4215 domain-containing protein [Kofleriaceae bacterium]|nr:DUF4215 domain-containing protein [Kofleriaceae bacterium]